MKIDLTIYESTGVFLSYTNWMKKFINYCEKIAGTDVTYNDAWHRLVDAELAKWGGFLVHYDDDHASTCIRFKNEQYQSLFLLKYS
jgi:hypothetical protein